MTTGVYEVSLYGRQDIEYDDGVERGVSVYRIRDPQSGSEGLFDDAGFYLSGELGGSVGWALQWIQPLLPPDPEPVLPDSAVGYEPAILLALMKDGTLDEECIEEIVMSIR